MGIDYSTYIGPYFECKTSEVEKESSVRSCTNTDCTEYKKQVWDGVTKFCPRCGTKIGKVPVMVKRENVDDEDIREKTKERISTPCSNCGEYVKGATLWYPNIKGSPGEHFDPKEDTYQYEIGDNDVKQAKKDMLEQFSNEYKVLCEAYGKENVEVKYGVLHQIY